MRLISTWQGIKCTAVACTFVAIAAALRLLRSSYFQLLGVKRAGALYLPMETLTTGMAAVLVFPIVLCEYFGLAVSGLVATRASQVASLGQEGILLHGQRFVPESTVHGIWRSFGMATLLAVAGLIFAGCSIVEYVVRVALLSLLFPLNPFPEVMFARLLACLLD